MTTDKVKIVSTNIHTMSGDTNLFVRSLTIALVGPTAVLLAAHNKYTCALLIWFFFFFGMLEWSGIRRHIKVAILLDPERGGDDSKHEALPKEYAAPVFSHSAVIIVKATFSSLVIVAACIGVDVFLLFLTLYFLVCTLLTLFGQNDPEKGLSVARQTADNVMAQSAPTRQVSLSSEKSRSEMLLLFLREELRMVAEKGPAELFINFCLEYFGFVWITGVTYPILVYDIEGLGKPWILASLVGNFTLDIVALLVGRSMKGMTHPLCQSISPKKSIEGAVLGVLAGAFIFLWSVNFASGGGVLERGWGPFFLNFTAGVLLGVMGVVGDLLQSLLKRTARIKDSGYLMPGHGGVLDRIDGLLLVFPTMYCCMRVMNLFS
ncbi:phosphatidate cytidylyltransferase-like protein, putative [Trypanosoma cruzi]|nr:phosphatidate cytidylyltransferase-like protein, putative [Trypanosoma cruzi]